MRETHWLVTRLLRVHTFTHLLEAMRILLPLVFGALTVLVFRRLGAVPGIYAVLAVAVTVFFAPESAGREFRGGPGLRRVRPGWTSGHSG